LKSWGTNFWTHLGHIQDTFGTHSGKKVLINYSYQLLTTYLPILNIP
jgi:hypothetical protein